jgi:D-xylose transport system permease protein
MDEIENITAVSGVRGRTPMSTIADLQSLLSQGQLRSLSMVGILILVWMAFQILTGGLFLEPRNLTNLSGQVAITAILAAGMVMVMIPGYIDLSLGASVAACAIIAAITSNSLGFTFWPAVTATLLFGLLIGLWHALWIAWLRVPSFIVTLASLLAIRGLAFVITDAETIPPSQEMLVISNASLSPELSIAFLVILWSLFATMQVREWRARLGARISVSFVGIVALPTACVGVLVACAAFVSASYRGIPTPVAIVMAATAITGAILRYTAFGRHLYAIGGNRQAAVLAGINVRRHAVLVLVMMGALYGISGLILVARLDSAPPDAEAGLELNVISAAVIGGTSLLGGRGTVGGAILGAVLMESLNNGMSLLNLQSAYQSITVGLVLLVAVFADIRSRGLRSALD